MLNKTHRFHGYGSVRKVYAKGLAVRGGQIGLKYVQRPGGQSFRVAVVVSRKVHKSAVKRNRIRRRIYETVRLMPEAIPAEYDLVFTVFSEQVAEMPAEELQSLV